MKPIVSRPLSAWILIILLCLLGIGAVISGGMLVAKPDGSLMLWSPEMLKGTPFSNYLIPGLILFTLVGLFSLFIAYGLITRTVWNGPDVINPFKKYHWSWTASWAEGVIILIWILTETMLLGFISGLQPFIIGWGLLLILLTMLPGIRRYYTKQN